MARKYETAQPSFYLREKAENGDLCFGTVDSYLCWNLLEGRPHVTDATNAGRTMLFNIHTQDWDGDLLKLLDIFPQSPIDILCKGLNRFFCCGHQLPIASAKNKDRR